MTLFSHENIQALVAEAYLPHAKLAFGDAGEQGIRTLLDSVKLVYQRCPPERLPGTLTVVVGIGASPATPAIGIYGNASSCSTYDEVGHFLVANAEGTSAIVEASADGTFRMLALGTDIDLKFLAQTALIYRFDGDSERILAKEHEDHVRRVSPLLKSNFAAPTFSGLEDALKYYNGFVAESKCRLLKEVWEGGVDGPRLILVNKPESIMRDSLAQALELILRDATVKPEQNTDETKPVDIRVNWFASGAVALIEVKWLGKATAISKTPGVATYTSYGASRAQSGADQLADYMDREVRFSVTSAPRGYLVVFDARRKDIKGASDPLQESDALAFENDVLQFNPDHSKTRPDFADPVRFFMRPRRSHFATA
jgi:hypothetical protein